MTFTRSRRLNDPQVFGRMAPLTNPRMRSDLGRLLSAQLFVSENTVKTHIKSIRRKLGLDGREDIVGRARELGLLPPG